MQRRLESKRAVVTGASSGVGASISLALAREGASLLLLGRNSDRLQAVADQCEMLGGSARCVVADLATESGIDHAGREADAALGGVDILVHSAGVFARCEIRSASLREFESQYRCNVLAPYGLTQRVLPALIEGRGQVVFINSTAGLVANANVAQYSATKHALKALADSLREEVNGFGVRVLSVYLGRTATPMQEQIHRLEGKSYHPERLIQPDQVALAVVCALTLGHESEITDIRIRPCAKPGPS